MKFTSILDNHEELNTRQIIAAEQVEKIRNEFKRNVDISKYKDIAIFCGGSLGRGDVGSKSDLDLFILSNNPSVEEKRIESLELLSEIININKKLGYPQFSNDAQYIKVYSFPDMIEILGSPSDDKENLFTVRMLLLLESKPIFNDELYSTFMDRTLSNYFRDSVGKDTFMPLFLLNDILRYWRTLCLNYEIIRNNPKRPWRKKNINLKFSRMLTVFGTVLPIIAEPATNKECITKLISMPPIGRLAKGLDIINDDDLSNDFHKFLSNYEEFLKMKENMGEKLQLDNITMGRRIDSLSDEFSDFIYKSLNHHAIDKEYIKYLVI